MRGKFYKEIVHKYILKKEIQFIVKFKDYIITVSIHVYVMFHFPLHFHDSFFPRTMYSILIDWTELRLDIGVFIFASLDSFALMFQIF